MVQLKHMQPRVNKQYQKGLCATNLCKVRESSLKCTKSHLCRERILPKFLYSTMPATNADASSSSIAQTHTNNRYVNSGPVKQVMLLKMRSLRYILDLRVIKPFI